MSACVAADRYARGGHLAQLGAGHEAPRRVAARSHPVVARADAVGDGEHRGRNSIACEHRHGVGEGVGEAVVEGDCHARAGPRLAAVEGIRQPLER
jgi:hypothetical protein